MTKPEFAAAMKPLVSLFKPPSPEAMDAYFRKLNTISMSDLQAAVSHVIDTFKPFAGCPFPSISHILDAHRAVTTSNQAAVPEWLPGPSAFEVECEQIAAEIKALPKEKQQEIGQYAANIIPTLLDSKGMNWFLEHGLDGLYETVMRGARRTAWVYAYCDLTGRERPSETIQPSGATTPLPHP